MTSRRARAGQPPRGVVGRVIRIVAGGIVVLSLVDGVMGQGGLLENQRLRAQNAEEEAIGQALELENEALREKTRRLKEDPTAIEDKAREDLGLIKDGELLIILRDVPAPTPTSPDSLRQDKKKR